MKNSMLFLLLSVATFGASAQIQEINNVSIGTDLPAIGVKINALFPNYTGSWYRGFSVAGQNSSNDYIMLGAFGNCINGTSKVEYGFIGNSYGRPNLSFRLDGKVGVGTVNPNSSLEVFNNFDSSHLTLSSYDNPTADGTRINIDFLVLNLGHVVGRIGSYYDNSQGGGYGGLRFYSRNAGVLNESYRISPIGNVLIGKKYQINNSYKLDVAGKIRADEITVNTNGADFVFDENYTLRPLNELESFIKENKHLPDIKPAIEMQTNGVNLSDINTKLLQKIEELTLYLINKDKEIANLQQQIDDLRQIVTKK